ncbi:hypothetical protein [Zhihengliuella halotolerans]|uniref:Uncharacterized protein n=1 Tax=Zhihengliuella halotolerans TaxID=370736 RepID=A0A4Q8ADK7_9MICC|nr:hypothetical protein [Zhihengliuella halotolerans]RZU61745.1 hypothetical protein EV380_1323 [Zhihengliuella halotolerans]
MAAKVEYVHVVKAAAVVVTVGGADRYLYRKAVLPEGVPEGEVKRLVAGKLVEKRRKQQKPETTGGAPAAGTAGDPAGNGGSSTPAGDGGSQSTSSGD